MVIDPNTGLLGLPCQPREYEGELCKQHGWIKTTYEPKTSYTEKMILGEEDEAIAEKAAKLIARDYGEVLKRLEDE